ncbi:glycosyltransferase family 4 protein [Shewanella aegiceratis]|uniref:glycosyltransferase family 4 protein n=1 Tax=Shewanella aegiceratis TaxID=2864203 RepID=UPI001C65C5B3|nr:glycosyltransferase family 4 protein [Shewanella aegiceratis]QYJ83759.1 glycosyltransferase family 4 protein [Shewanella aegiceratis]
MKVLHVNFVPEQLLGVKRKIYGQIEALRANGHTVVVGQYNNEGYSFGEEQIFSLRTKNRFFRKLLEVFIMLRLLRKINFDFDYIYIRYMRLTPWFFMFLRALGNKGARVIIEVPTYPYDKEYRKDGLYYSDIFFRRYLHKYVLGVTYVGAKFQSVWGMPALDIHNGIDIENLKLSNANRKSKGADKDVNFIGVANLSDWHGYDRFIMSMSILDRKVLARVKFHIVGDGEVLGYLQGLVQALNLTENVIFYGNRSGEDLDSIFEYCQIGVASLGLYRIGHEFITPLKPAEYTARGLPFILANADERFFDVSFKYQIENNGSNFNIKDILDWYYSLNCDPCYLRDYAIEHLSWENQMKKIDDFYNHLITEVPFGDNK